MNIDWGRGKHNAREKVIYALRCRGNGIPSTCSECSYYNSELRCCYLIYIIKDALVLLEEQQPRVLDWNEIGTVDGAVWLEDRDKSEVVPGLVMQMHSAVNLDIKKDGKLHKASASRSDYGDRWRAWSAKPTEEQMRDTKWEWSNDE